MVHKSFEYWSKCSIFDLWIHLPSPLSVQFRPQRRKFDRNVSFFAIIALCSQSILLYIRKVHSFLKQCQYDLKLTQFKLLFLVAILKRFSQVRYNRLGSQCTFYKKKYARQHTAYSRVHISSEDSEETIHSAEINDTSFEWAACFH